MIVVREYLHYRRKSMAAKRRRPDQWFGSPRHWLGWALRDEVDSAWSTVRVVFDGLPMPPSWDIAVSGWVRRWRLSRWSWLAYAGYLNAPGCCDVCTARWQSGRCLRHEWCGRAIERHGEDAMRALDRKLFHPIEPPRSTW